jgi:hypothetical protein
MLESGKNPGYLSGMCQDEGFSALIEVTIDTEGNTLPHLIKF